MMIDNPDLEAAYDDLECCLMEFIDNLDDESYDKAQAQLKYISCFLDEITKQPPH